jgi:hypothetical protein
MIQKKFIVGGVCQQVKAYNGDILTPDGTKVYAYLSDGYPALGRGRSNARRCPDENMAMDFLSKCDGMPWYYRMKPGSAFIEDVTLDYRLYSKAELVAEVERLRALHGL